MTEIPDAGRHPIRALFKLAAVAGVIYAIGRFLIQMKEEYADLTESEARQKLLDKVGPRLGEETAADIADQVIPKLKERGFIQPDPVTDPVDEVTQ